MASSYYDIFHVEVRQFAYLKCPSKIRAAMINAGGERLSVDTIRRRLLDISSGQPMAHIGEPRESDGRDFRVAGLVRLEPARPPRISDEERKRIAELAAKIPQRKPPRTFREKIAQANYCSTDFSDAVVDHVCAALDITPDVLKGNSRQKYLVAARALVVRVLRERNPVVYSYPRCAVIVGRRDHSTMINLFNQFDYYCTLFPALREIYHEISGGAQ